MAEPELSQPPSSVPDGREPTIGLPDDSMDDSPMVMPAGLWEKIKSDPQYAPEHIALEAVTRLGPQAMASVEGMRAMRPWAPPDALAHLIAKRFINRARLSGAVSGMTGLPGALVDVGVLAWTQSCMVLHLAAAYGNDPTDPRRAADLLVLQEVHKYAEGARAALDVAAGRQRVSEVLSRKDMTASQVFVQLGMKLAQMAGVGAGKRIVAKIVPGASVILGTWANSSATTELASRATAMYRSRPAISAPPGGEPTGM